MTTVMINPNSTQSMTDAMLSEAQAAVPGPVFSGATSHDGPPSIQGPRDGDKATPPLLDLVDEIARAGADGIIIGCFDDTALQSPAARVSCPVIGIGQAAYHHAALRQWRFSVVTTLPISVPILKQNIRDFGFDQHLGRVRASNVPVLALESDPAASATAILHEAQRAAEED